MLNHNTFQISQQRFRIVILLTVLSLSYFQARTIPLFCNRRKAIRKPHLLIILDLGGQLLFEIMEELAYQLQRMIVRGTVLDKQV